MYRQPMLVGVTAEVLAGVLLWLSAGDGAATGMAKWAILGAIAFHAISSYFLAWGFWQLLPRRYKLPARRPLGFLFVLLLILPVAGALGVLWSVVSALKQPRGRAFQGARIIRLPELPFSPPVIYEAPPYSQGALRQIVHFAARPLKRLKAVMATRHMPPRDAMAVWSKATRDPVDDVRLLAYAMLDNSEKKLADRILVLTEALPDLPVRRRNASHKTIAALCWELVYHRLVQGAVRQHWLATARRHIEFALMSPDHVTGKVSGHGAGHGSRPASTTLAVAALPSSESREIPESPAAAEAADADSWMLYGRILLEANDLAQAKKAFARAQGDGMGEQKVAPWLAEIAFHERKFADVRRHLSAGGRRGEKGRDLALVTAWWNR
ncbi:protein PelE [Nitrosospira sp. Is2]|uniref:protein PelE n=1 Tax=Nitrosospira sp. Is2 TaxID=3080532 RepID=UPI002954D98F|nr:protein PelE [Nitrosospira sp. Is2]WON74276.1 protein PelE [Nitrosospira sp. Is2]